MSPVRSAAILTASLLFHAHAHAVWFFFVPLPNVSMPDSLKRIVDALEKSEQTKALAVVHEDKTFGSKYWVWGPYSGDVTQDVANENAMRRCEAGLARARGQMAGGKALYDFGSNRCALYEFKNKTISSKIRDQPAVAATQSTAPPIQQQSESKGDAPIAKTSSEQPRFKEAAAEQKSPTESDGPTARKLRELQQMLKEGLITDAEFQEKRRSILSAM